MKQIVFLMSLCIYLASERLCAQDAGQIVDSVEIWYKSVNEVVLDSTGQPAPPRVTAEVRITTASAQSTGIISIKMYQPNSTLLLYSATYSLSSDAVIDNNGIKLFERNGNEIRLTNPNVVPLDLYSYEIQTTGGQNNNSTIYTITQ